MNRLFMGMSMIVLVIGGCSKPIEIAESEVWGLPEIPPAFGAYNEPSDNPLTQEKWELGKRIFYDNALSIDGSLSCASCHDPAFAFGSDVATSPGVNQAPGTRNVPSLANTAWHPFYTREGGVPTLEMQVLVPIQESNEFNHNIVLIAEAMAADPDYVELTQTAFQTDPSPFTITRALAAFERSMVSGASPYDKWWEGDVNAMSPSALSGMELFDEKGCSACHSGPLFSDFELRNNGLYSTYPDSGLYRLTLDPSDIGKFKTPSLRNLSFTAPYMFDGSIATLPEIIDHYSSGGANHPNQDPEITPFEISALEREHLIEFLNSLNDPTFVAWCKSTKP